MCSVRFNIGTKEFYTQQIVEHRAKNLRYHIWVDAIQRPKEDCNPYCLSSLKGENQRTFIQKLLRTVFQTVSYK